MEMLQCILNELVYLIFQLRPDE